MYMKLLKLLFLALMLGSTCAYAQNEDYNRISANFASVKLKPENIDAIKTKGAGLEYVHGLSLSDNLPIYFEFGGGFDITANSDTNLEQNRKSTRFASVYVPLNGVYKFNVPDTRVFLSPYAGLNFKVNLVGKQQLLIPDKKINFFDSKEDLGLDAHRLQFGLNLGLGVDLRYFFLGYRFNADFTKYADEAKTRTHLLSIGVTF